MLHVDKPLPLAVTHNDEIAREILIELRGLRDDLAARQPLAAVARLAVQAGPMVELREPAPPVSAIEDTPKPATKKRGA